MEKTGLYTAARVFARVMTSLFFPVKYHGLENLSLKAPYVVVANHRHWFDPLLIGFKIKPYEVHFLGKKELAATPFIKKCLLKLHMIIVDRHNSDMAAMRECVNTIKQGHVLGIFPEGTRCKNSVMEHVESGAAFIALRAKVPIIPFYIESPVKLFRMTHVYVGAPIETEDLYAQPYDNDAVKTLEKRMVDSVRGLMPGKS